MDSNQAHAAMTTVASVPVLTYPYAPYNEGRMDPQLAGWPLTDAERAWVIRPEGDRRPGSEVGKQLPELWPVTPAAAYWPPAEGEGNVWIDSHATLVGQVLAAKEGLDIALIGDSITQAWGGGWDGSPFRDAWTGSFGAYRTVNIGIGGDRTEHILWRLDHGGLGVAPRVAVLMIGVNNVPAIPASGVPAEAVARGIQLCVRNLRARCPEAHVVVIRVLPAFAAGTAEHEETKAVNRALDGLGLGADPRVHVLDPSGDFAHADGSCREEAYAGDYVHLSDAGYELLGGLLKPVIDGLLGGR